MLVAAGAITSSPNGLGAMNWSRGMQLELTDSGAIMSQILVGVLV